MMQLTQAVQICCEVKKIIGLDSEKEVFSSLATLWFCLFKTIPNLEIVTTYYAPLFIICHRPANQFLFSNIIN
jgi:hypothetical protein